MKCPNCGYENPAEGTKDNRCDQCGYLLAQNKSAPHSTQIVPKQFINCDLVVIAIFNNSYEATLMQGILKDQGIESWLQDEAMVNIAWYLTVALGYIKLYVREEDEELARTILDEYQASSNEKTSEDRDLKDEDEALSELTSTDKILRRAFRSAVVGLAILPLQLYSLWLLLTLSWKGLPRTPRQRLTLLSTLGLDLAVLIVIWSFISIR